MAVVRVLHSRVLYGKRSRLQKRVCVSRFGMGVSEERHRGIGYMAVAKEGWEDNTPGKMLWDTQLWKIGCERPNFPHLRGREVGL